MNSIEKFKLKRSFSTATNEETSPSYLSLNQNTHKIEPNELIIQGHLQKHIRNSTHKTQAAGLTTPDKPRLCGSISYDTASKKYCHLALHMGDESHMTKLKSDGLIPIRTYSSTRKNSSEIRDRLAAVSCEGKKKLDVTMMTPHRKQPEKLPETPHLTPPKLILKSVDRVTYRPAMKTPEIPKFKSHVAKELKF